MFGYKCALKLGGKNIELINYSYGFSQSIDDVGKPVGDVFAGSIQFSFANLPTTEMLEWMVNSRKYKNGEVVILGNDDATLQKISFETGACVNMNISYSESGASYCLTTITVMAKKIQIGDATVENGWQNI